MYENNNQLMTQEEYNYVMTKKLQERSLSDEGVAEVVSQQRAIERDIHKAQLRMMTEAHKQSVKMKEHKISIRNNATVLDITNGEKVIVHTHELFTCEVKNVRRFKRAESEDKLFQIIIFDKSKNMEVESPLYDMKILQSLSKLRNTILARYDCTISQEIGKTAWKWMQKMLISMFESADSIVIPGRPGWFNINERWHFWNNTEESSIFLNEEMRKFRVDQFDVLDAGAVVKTLVNNLMKSENKKYASVLLIIRLVALLGRLATDDPFRIGVTLIGNGAESVAMAYLRTMNNNIDIVNIDSDRISVIREKMKILQDTPMIFVSSNPNSRSTQNRIREVTSWMQSGYVEGDKTQIPYIFCLQKFSKEYPLDSTIVLNIEEKEKFGDKILYAKIQALIIKIIETSGTYWVEQCKCIHEKTKDEEIQGDTDKVKKLIATIVMVVSKMFDSDSVGQKTHYELCELLHIGMEEIQQQFSIKTGVILEVFREKVVQLVSKKRVLMEMREKVSQGMKLPVIYFDADHYYFTKNSMNSICSEALIGEKSILHVKQQLADQDALKMYKNGNEHNRELEVDFWVCNAYGQRKTLSGLAIKRRFFDEIGEVELCERGGKAYA